MLLKLLLISLLACTILGQRNVSEIIRGYGYPCEEHSAPTDDGWLLSMQRIPHGLHNTKATKGAVLFIHGLTDSSVGICLNPPSESLAFILADNGYDVWLGNNRGNGYSMKNIHYTSDQAEFWDFSWDEMAQYDLPSQINYALKVSGEARLAYIGHSEGTIQAFAGFLNKDLASKVKVFIALAPVAYVGNQEVVILKELAKLHGEAILSLLGVKEFYLPDVIEKIIPSICRLDPSLCEHVLELLLGPFTYANESRDSYYLTYEPNPTSVKNIAHWAQGVRTKAFEHYDYGTQGNMQHYNQPTPPAYNLKDFPTDLPVALFAGGTDYLADPTDVQLLINQLPKAPSVHIEPDYGHMDPLWGTNAYIKIYPLILNILASN